jgi:epoxyqueuosine reductase QueG
MLSTTVKLTIEIREYARSEGAALVGFAPVGRFRDAPKGHGPCDFLPEAKSVIVLGMRISDSIVDYVDYHKHFTGRPSWAVDTASRLNWAQLAEWQIYKTMGHYVQDELLLYLSTKIAWKLEDQGYKSMPMPATTERGMSQQEMRWSQSFFPWSQRHSAVLAGLGEFGYNNIVITPEFGPRIRFGSIITEAEFEYTPLIKQKICLREQCRKCLDSCTSGAIQLRDGIDIDQVFITTPAKTDYRLCLTWDERGITTPCCFFYGTCLRVCPVKPDLKIKKEIRRSYKKDRYKSSEGKVKGKK